MYPATPTFKGKEDSKIKIQKSTMLAFDMIKKQELLRAAAVK